MENETHGVRRLIVKFKDPNAADLDWPFVALDREIKSVYIDGDEWVRKRTSKDSVENPEHYTSGDVECIEAIEAQMSREQFAGYLRGCVVKYVWRYEMKGGAEDLRKAAQYLDWLIEAVGR